MKQISRYIMTLVALFAMTAGAWAEETATITLKCGTTEKTYENVTLPWSTTAEILKEVISDFKFSPSIGAITGGNDKVVKYGNENLTVNGTFSGEATVAVSYLNTSMASASATITVTAPGPLMTLSDDGKTATMEEMPANDVTVDYELVRDLTVGTSLNIVVIEGTEAVALTEDSRLRIAKNGVNGYLPVNTITCAFIDGIENVTMTPQQIIAAGMTPVFYLLGENDTWTPVPAANINPQTMLPNNIAPNQTYRMTLVANEGSIYDGETAPTVTITLFEGYEVTIPAGEYATYFKDENLTLDTEETEAKLYTITEVGTETATATELTVAKANMPILVFNGAQAAKTILLIPTETEGDEVTAYEGFIGTLTATTIAASTSEQNNYAFNGKQFVWVKNDLAVGANRAWLAIPTGAQSAPVLKLVFGESTGVNEVIEVNGVNDNSWYDLNGRKLQNAPTKKGIYILNGRKVVIK